MEVTLEEARANPVLFQHLDTSTQCAARGLWRQCNDAYRAAFEVSGPSLRRSYCLSGYCSTLNDRSAYPPTDRDVSFLKKIAKDENELRNIRASAWQTLSYIAYDKLDREKATLYKKRAIDLCDQASEAERRVLLLIMTMLADLGRPLRA